MDDKQLRFIVFVAAFLLMAFLEAVFPRRTRNFQRSSRWTTNLSLAVINSLVLKLMGPVAAIAAADYALDNGWGLLSRVVLPFWLELVVGVVLLDLAIYAQHVASHKIPILWRMHKVHHVDRDIDVTTGIRFHPLEAVLSMCYKCMVVLLLGPVTMAVFLFEMILNASAMFNHANLRLPFHIDRILRLVVITPDMHRVHHSTVKQETDSNYGFFLSIWDRFFQTYIPQPQRGHTGMTIGLQQYQDKQVTGLSWSVLLPFERGG